jgi:hypothetical protein
MATVNLGSIKFKWKGTYSGATAYTVDDVVSYNGSSYICILASTGNLPTNATYFEQMSSAGTNGTNGTDLTTTLTTQGDLVYRDGSGLQRLGAGTAGQVLQTGGAGANPSWGSVSSDYVKLAETTLSTNAHNITLDGYFSSTYDNYVLEHYDYSLNGGSDIYYRFLDGGSEVTSSHYCYFNDYMQINNSNSTSCSVVNGFDQPYLRLSAGGAGTPTGDYTPKTIMYISKPLSTNMHKMVYGFHIYTVSNNAEWTHTRFGGFYRGNQNAISGITFYPSSGSIDWTKGTIKLYGIK